MSTKRLSKTVIEGGRYGRNKFERRQSHVEVRAQERDYLKAVVGDREHYDEYDIDVRKPVHKGFTDKLAPMYRWLDAQVGRPWDEVRAEVFQKFDTRTTAGRHITFDHLLREVVDTQSGFDKYGRIVDPEIPTIPSKSGRIRYYGFNDYYVDQQGILRAMPEKSTKNSRRESYPSKEEYQTAGIWLNGRMVKEDAGKLHWVCPNQDIWMASWYDPYDRATQSYPYQGPSLSYYVLGKGEYEVAITEDSFVPSAWRYVPYVTYVKRSGPHWEKIENPYSFRRRGPLSEDEVKVFKDFKFGIRNQILAYTKGR